MTHSADMSPIVRNHLWPAVFALLGAMLASLEQIINEGLCADVSCILLGVGKAVAGAMFGYFTTRFYPKAGADSPWLTPKD